MSHKTSLAAPEPAGEGGWFEWWREAPRDARRALWAAALGWMLDAFDVMLYALVLTAVISDLGLTKATAGLIGSVTLVAGAVGGVAFGVVADRYGRTRALMGSILMYSVFTAMCGLAQTGWQLALFRIGLGLGMGGEWASGAALVAETWPDEHRGKALGLMQSAWAVGYALAAIVTSLCCRSGAGARSSSSACCRRCSPSGSVARCQNPHSGASRFAMRPGPDSPQSWLTDGSGSPWRWR